MRFGPTDPDSGGQVNLSASVASLILPKVPDGFPGKLELASFDIRQGGKTGDRFGSPDNLQIAARFTNKGNVQVAPFGKISVMQGDNVVYEADFNTKQPRDMVLPDSARRWELPLEKIGSFGHYTVTATFTYGEQNQTLEISKSFWVIPTALVIGLIVGLLLLLLVTWLFGGSYAATKTEYFAVRARQTFVADDSSPIDCYLARQFGAFRALAQSQSPSRSCEYCDKEASEA